MRLMAFPTEAVSVVPAHVSIDHALAGRGDRYEHHFLAACRTTRENRWDAIRRYAYCRHVRTSLSTSLLVLPYHNGLAQKKFRLGPRILQTQIRPLRNSSRPQGVKTGQRPTRYGKRSCTKINSGTWRVSRHVVIADLDVWHLRDGRQDAR